MADTMATIAWYPIADAKPKFGDPVLLAYRDVRGRRCVGEGEWGLGAYDRSRREYDHGWTLGAQRIIKPYAWAPLPKAPDPKLFAKEERG